MEASDAVIPHHPLATPHHAANTLERIAWSKPDSRTLERLVWSVYDGILSPGPTPKLTGPETYNQVTKQLATKVFRGLQVRCPARTSAQFDEPSPVRKLRSVVFAPPPSGSATKAEVAETASPKSEEAEEGAVGGDAEVDADPDMHPMAWMRDRQRCYNEEMISFWPLLHPLMDGGRTATPCAPLAVNMGMVLRHAPHILPSRSNQHGDRTMATSG